VFFAILSPFLGQIMRHVTFKTSKQSQYTTCGPAKNVPKGRYTRGTVQQGHIPGTYSIEKITFCTHSGWRAVGTCSRDINSSDKITHTGKCSRNVSQGPVELHGKCCGDKISGKIVLHSFEQNSPDLGVQTEGHVPTTRPCDTFLLHFPECVSVEILSLLHIPATRPLVYTERDFVAAVCPWDISLPHVPSCMATLKRLQKYTGGSPKIGLT